MSASGRVSSQLRHRTGEGPESRGHGAAPGLVTGLGQEDWDMALGWDTAMLSMGAEQFRGYTGNGVSAHPHPSYPCCRAMTQQGSWLPGTGVSGSGHQHHIPPTPRCNLGHGLNTAPLPVPPGSWVVSPC